MNLRILLTPMLSFGRSRAALRKRRPERIDRNGKSPLCDSYESAPQLESGR